MAIKLHIEAIRRTIRRIDDHWIGDLVGAACLFGGLWLGLWTAALLG